MGSSQLQLNSNYMNDLILQRFIFYWRVMYFNIIKKLTKELFKRKRHKISNESSKKSRNSNEITKENRFIIFEILILFLWFIRNFNLYIIPICYIGSVQ